VDAKSILVVDDDPNVRLVFRLILESDGYAVREARDGIAALILIKDHVPDLVITDLMMPRMGGRELIERMRADARSAHVPILAVTGNPAMKEQISGADWMLDKPIDRSVLLDAVRSLINKKPTPTELATQGN
jgi:CheY-like chemotaxis protein